MNAIEVTHISKSFIIPHEKRDTLREWVASGFRRREKDILHALDDVSFTVKKGESFGIIGRNGSGKSTLLKVLAGIYPVDKGKVKIHGKISPFLELGVGFNYDLSARDNVYLNGTVLGLSKTEIDAQFDEIIRFAELEQFVDQKLKNFSSGMQVRLAFSVAIKAEAEIYLMDEVLAVGDMAFQQKCFEVFRQFKKQGKTLIFVSHDLSAVRQFCDRCLYLKKGKEIVVGRVNPVLDKYIYEDRTEDSPIHEPKASIQKIENETREAKPVSEKRRIVKIGNVRILDKNSLPVRRIVTNDMVRIEIELVSFESLNDVIAGIMLKNADGTPLFGTSTDILGCNIDIGVGRSVCTFTLAALPIKQGPIHVTVAIRQQGRVDHFDWRNDTAKFDIIDTSREVGLISVDTRCLLS